MPQPLEILPIHTAASLDLGSRTLADDQLDAALGDGGQRLIEARNIEAITASPRAGNKSR